MTTPYDARTIETCAEIVDGLAIDGDRSEQMIPALLAEVDRLRAEVERMTKCAAHWRNEWSKLTDDYTGISAENEALKHDLAAKLA